ncbi:MAG: polar amino acid transport system substrate-binding protein [Marinobacter excellens HL-55]|uniref:Polar amino acid transport system substrate-binding protein n=1 Tax=Marinobacter excellens HL-55 TaxID=1305731 RepID=A0A0N8KKR9_9GAMM|nr:MAG: polar amino acid transport system substrate-binding protein [Marinobacter excellens HL-55]
MRSCQLFCSDIPGRALALVGLFVLLICQFYPMTAYAAEQDQQDPRIVRVAYVEFPPMSYRDALGEPQGEFVDITRKVAEEAGYELEFLYLPVTRTYLYLQNGTVDLWLGLTNIPALSDEVLESWISPIPVELSAWYREDTAPLDHMDQLHNETVILIGGYTYGGLRFWLEDQPDIRITEAPNHRSAIDMLKRERGNYLLDYRQPVREALTQPSDAIVRESELRTRNTAWLFSLASPRASILREAFDDAYFRLAERGEVPPVRKLRETFFLPGFPEAHR